MIKFIKTVLIIIFTTLLIFYVISLSQKKINKKRNAKIVKQSAINEIDITFNELKDEIGKKSAEKIDKVIDKAIENAKNELDRLSSQIKADAKKNIK